MSGSHPGDRIIRAENGNPLLDADGDPFSELVLDSVDAASDAEVTVAELAFGKRSWRFGHVIVDEAQDLTPMQWRMVARRARAKSMTIVGDLAQRSIGEPGAWTDHVPSSLGDFAYAELTINYRAPEEVNRMAAGLLSELAPSLQPGTSIRSVGHRPEATRVASIADALPGAIQTARTVLPGGKLAVVAAPHMVEDPVVGEIGLRADVLLLNPWHCKGLEFDAVIVLEPGDIMAMEHGLSLLYVAATRTTNRLQFLHQKPLPEILVRALAESKQH